MTRRRWFFGVWLVPAMWCAGQVLAADDEQQPPPAKTEGVGEQAATVVSGQEKPRKRDSRATAKHDPIASAFELPRAAQVNGEQRRALDELKAEMTPPLQKAFEEVPLAKGAEDKTEAIQQVIRLRKQIRDRIQGILEEGRLEPAAAGPVIPPGLMTPDENVLNGDFERAERDRHWLEDERRRIEEERRWAERDRRWADDLERQRWEESLRRREAELKKRSEEAARKKKEDERKRAAVGRKSEPQTPPRTQPKTPPRTEPRPQPKPQPQPQPQPVRRFEPQPQPKPQPKPQPSFPKPPTKRT